MATYQPITRRETVRALQSVAVQARREGDRETWQRAVHEWSKYATTTEQRKAPAAIAKPWQMEG